MEKMMRVVIAIRYAFMMILRMWKESWRLLTCLEKHTVRRNVEWVGVYQLSGQHEILISIIVVGG
jgi:hypothetical protein